MQTSVTSFNSPFSFFCTGDEMTADLRELQELESSHPSSTVGKTEISSLVHGQYIAVYWMEKWIRGIVSKRQLVLVWLVDYGCYIRPQEKTRWKPLTNEVKKIPSKIFEASIHGVMPVDKKMDNECEIKDVMSTCWNTAAVERAKKLIQSAIKISFVPVALLTTEHNDIVLGDLYLDLPTLGFVNIVDELAKWPVFLKKTPEDFVKNLPLLYKHRRHHHGCPLKPCVRGLPELGFHCTLQEYNTIVSTNVQPQYHKKCEPIMEDGSTVVGENGRDLEPKKKNCYLSPQEFEEYSHQHVVVNGKKYNMLNVLVSKARDFEMCQRYMDHDLKGMGRGCSFPTHFYF